MNRLLPGILILLVLVIRPIGDAQTQPAPDQRSDVRRLLQQFTGFSPDPCGPPFGAERDWHTTQLETPLFDKSAELLVDALNSGTGPMRERAEDAVRGVERASNEINADWPIENRFHFEILDLKEILIAKFSIRMHDSFLVFGIPQMYSDKPNQLWRRITLIEDDTDRETPRIVVELYPMHSSSSGKPRFLVRTLWSGCAGSIGVTFDAREWNSEFYGGADQIINVNGALGLDDKIKDFPQIGVLQTKGPIIDLPYCWWSALDTWDNPSMCAVDRFDVSQDEIKFVSRRVNRPDLLPIARAAEYAKKRDFPAVRAYCTNDAVARRLVTLAPDRLFDVEVDVKPEGARRELVYEDGGSFRFVVEKRRGNWLIASLGD